MAADWDISWSVEINGKTVNRGDEVSIPWEGRFRFLRHVRTPAGKEWVDLYGGKAHHENLRSFRPERIKTIHKNRIIASKKERALA